MLMNGVNIREVQELLGHKNVETTMIYTHVIKRHEERPDKPSRCDDEGREARMKTADVRCPFTVFIRMWDENRGKCFCVRVSETTDFPAKRTSIVHAAYFSGAISARPVC
jgi:hypothetical protein